MGEEEKKPEECHCQPKETEPEKKKEDEAAEDIDKKSGEDDKEKEIVLRVHMHCEGCARKVRRCLKGFEGVEEVKTDCRANQVTVKGEKADPLKVLERVQRKTHRRAQLVSPVPKPQTPPPPEPEEKEPVKSEENKEEPPPLTVALGVSMHCEACAQEIKKRILRMKGVGSVEPDIKNSRVIVKGVFESERLVDFVYRRIGKHATVINVEQAKKEEEKPKEEKEEKKPEESEKKEPKAGEDADGDNPPAKDEAAEDPKLDLKRNDFYYFYPQSFYVYPQRFSEEDLNFNFSHAAAAYPPQMFSDENPNACSVM